MERQRCFVLVWCLILLLFIIAAVVLVAQYGGFGGEGIDKSG